MATIKRGTARRLGLRRPAKSTYYALRPDTYFLGDPWRGIGVIDPAGPTFRAPTVDEVVAGINARLADARAVRIDAHLTSSDAPA